jgi:hypothetical protein
MNKNLIPKLDLTMLSDEDLYRVFDIKSPRTIEVLGKMMTDALQKYYNPIDPCSTFNSLRLVFNRSGYDFDITGGRMDALRMANPGEYVDFPMLSYTNALYPYQIDQTYPGRRVVDDGIESKLGYKLVMRLHVEATSITGYGITTMGKTMHGEIIPQS